MRTRIQKYTAFNVLAMMFFQIMIPFQVSAASNDEVVYPLKQISKLECRFEDFDTLASNCKESLPILKTKDYKKYATKNGWYNDFTRIYTVLWGSSYKYGWDVGNGWHLGTDIATAKWTPVYSIADGKVVKVGNDVAWGKHVSIEHTVRGKKIVSNYAHLSKINVSQWDKVDVSEKIWEVWSTGNSTWNHLHFQIDLPHLFHPYYYNWNSCPYSYYEISESDKCFDELGEHTLDPLNFLETSGAILDKIDIVTEKVTSSHSTSKSPEYDYSIFSTTISPEWDGTRSQIKEVQRIYKDLGYYDGKISGNYDDLEDALIDYQIDRWVIISRDDIGSGWFGPKTRAQTQQDYTKFLKSWEALVVRGNNSSTTSTVRKVWNTKTTVDKVSRASLLTREEIEAMEVQEFLKKYDINFSESISQIQEGATKTTILQVTDSKERGFKWNTPGNVTFEYDTSKISVFPEKFYHFTGGEREIYITGKQSGHTTLKVKIGDVIIKSFSISIGTGWDTPHPESGKIYIDPYSVLWDTKTAIVLMKDQYGNKLVKSRYDGNFEITSRDGIEYCIKRGTVQNIKALYKRKCFEEEYSQSLSFNYDDTIGGLLMFDYRILDTESATLELKINGNTNVIAKETVKTQVPQWLTTRYEYFEDVIQSLSLWITNGIRNDYFLQDKNLSQYDAKNWIANTIKQMAFTDKDEQLKKLKKEVVSKYTYMTREEFLRMSVQYLWINQISLNTKDYKDLWEKQELLVASLVGNQYEWKDGFWEDYFQPDKDISRWEAAYLLMRILEKQWDSFLVRR